MMTLFIVILHANIINSVEINSLDSSSTSFIPYSIIFDLSNLNQSMKKFDIEFNEEENILFLEKNLKIVSKIIGELIYLNVGKNNTGYLTFFTQKKVQVSEINKLSKINLLHQ